MFTKKESNFCKGIAIILMIFHHLFFKAEDYQGFLISFVPFTEERINFYALLGKICVAIFVFISGYGIAAAYRKQFNHREPTPKDIFHFTWRRLWKLMSMYWFAFLLTLACQPLGWTIIDAYGTNIKDIFVYFLADLCGLAHMFGTPTLNPAWWYMTLALAIVFIMPIIMKMIDKLGAMTVLCGGMALLFLLNASNVNSAYLFSLFLGVGCFENRFFEWIEDLWREKRFGSGIKVILEIILFLIFISLRTNYNYFGIIDGFIALDLAALVSTFFIHIPGISPVMQFIGKHSGNMFLIHNQIYSYYFKDFIYSFRHWILIVFMLTVVSLGVSVLMEVLKKVIKYQKIMKQIEDRIL